jgi:hypothetical protein
MHCMNCGKQIPDDAQHCEFCEAIVEPELPEEAMLAVQDILEQMDPDVLDALRQHAGRSATADEFANRILVGVCPACGSEDTGDCEQDPDIDSILVGRCFGCGQLWCTECDRLLQKGQPVCQCWTEN